ncbi:MAG: hypothetical protein HY671_15370 [Chloroflexi bacterium]|nr:hypothetical protein [Chloroflexota bacterium]
MRRILFLVLAALLALMPVTTAYAGGGDEERVRDRDIEINLGDLDEEDFDIEFNFRPFRVPEVEIEIAPGVEIEVPFFTGLGFLLRRNLGALGLFGLRPFVDVRDVFNVRDAVNLNQGQLNLGAIRDIRDLRDR